MQDLTPTLKNLVLIVSLLAALAGCAGLYPQPEDAVEAEARAQLVIALLNSQNRELMHYKGIGNIRIRCLLAGESFLLKPRCLSPLFSKIFDNISGHWTCHPTADRRHPGAPA